METKSWLAIFHWLKAGHYSLKALRCNFVGKRSVVIFGLVGFNPEKGIAGQVQGKLCSSEVVLCLSNYTKKDQTITSLKDLWLFVESAHRSFDGWMDCVVCSNSCGIHIDLGLATFVNCLSEIQSCFHSAACDIGIGASCLGFLLITLVLESCLPGLLLKVR